ncbi:MAG: hypothetical protein LBL72_04325 [Candidatus Accumulibacter sp.]|jgi:hypothetical protein|nr:hypothetical protein [Accumulibacter sp.]
MNFLPLEKNLMKKLFAIAVCLALIPCAAQGAPRNAPRGAPRSTPRNTPAARNTPAPAPVAAPATDPAPPASGTPTFSTTYDAAMKGNLNMQRLLAVGYSSTPLEGQIIDPVQGCAWFIVVSNSGSKDLIPADASNQKLFCGGLTGTFLATAQTEAKRLLKQVYNK